MVKRGYKQTEVGVIPEEWKIESIGTLIENRTILGHLDGNHGELYPRSHEFKSFGVPYIGANDFEEGDVTFERCKFLTEERASKFRKGVACDGDVLFAHNATVGPVALLRTPAPLVILSTTATYFRCNPEKLSNSYLKGALQAQHFVKQYQAVMAQSTRFQVPITAQRKLSLVIPPIDEQRAIATALSDVDALLGALDRLIAKKRDLKQAAMQQLLTGQIRLPGFHGEWEVKRLAEICEIAMGRTPPRLNQAYWGRGYKWLSIADLQTKVVSTSNEEITELAASMMTIIPEGTLLMSFKLSLGRLCFAGCDLFTNEAICSFNKLQANAEFLYYVLGRTDFSLYGKLAVKGYTLNKESLKTIEVSVPPLPEQIAIAKVLSDMDTELAALEQRREKTHALKQAMMQDLLTGRTRLV
jgi:type I restriction enzyme S subunit